MANAPEGKPSPFPQPLIWIRFYGPALYLVHEKMSDEEIGRRTRAAERALMSGDESCMPHEYKKLADDSRQYMADKKAAVKYYAALRRQERADGTNSPSKSAALPMPGKPLMRKWSHSQGIPQDHFEQWHEWITQKGIQPNDWHRHLKDFSDKKTSPPTTGEHQQ